MTFGHPFQLKLFYDTRRDKFFDWGVVHPLPTLMDMGFLNSETHSRSVLHPFLVGSLLLLCRASSVFSCLHPDVIRAGQSCAQTTKPRTCLTFLTDPPAPALSHSWPPQIFTTGKSGHSFHCFGFN